MPILNDDYPGTQKILIKKVYLTLALFSLLGSWFPDLMQKTSLQYGPDGRSRRLESLAITSSCRYPLYDGAIEPVSPLQPRPRSWAPQVRPAWPEQGHQTCGLHCNNISFYKSNKKEPPVRIFTIYPFFQILKIKLAKLYTNHCLSHHFSQILK